MQEVESLEYAQEDKHKVTFQHLLPASPSSRTESAAPSYSIMAYPCGGLLADHFTVTIIAANTTFSRTLKGVIYRLFPSDQIIYNEKQEPYKFGVKRLFTTAELEQYRKRLEELTGEAVRVTSAASCKIYRVAARFLGLQTRGTFRTLTLFTVATDKVEAINNCTEKWRQILAMERGGMLVDLNISKREKGDPYDKKYDENGFWVEEMPFERGVVKRALYNVHPTKLPKPQAD